MIAPFLKDDAFLEDVAQASKDQESLHVWWLGQSGFLLQHNGIFLLFDPYLSDSLTKKYATTDKPHVRMTERVVEPSRLDFLSVVTSTHNHTDHLDAETLLPLMKTNPDLTLILPEANRSFAAKRLQCDVAWPKGLNDGESIQVGDITVYGVPAAHEALDRDEAGRCRFMGYVAKMGPFSIYHSGDTMRYAGMEEILRPFKIDLALLPINGSKPERRVAGNLDGREAAELAKNIEAKMVVPCHYDMFTFNTESPDTFAAACKEFRQPYTVMKNGERLTLRA